MSESTTADDADAETEETTEEQESELMSRNYGNLMQLGRSAREQFESVSIDTDAPKKNELVEELEQYAPEGSRADGWTVEVDGTREEVDLLEVQTPDGQGTGTAGPTDSTILYCLTRAETTEERVEEIREALEENTDYTVTEAGNGDKYAIVLPAENHPDYIPPEEREAEEEDEEDDEETPEVEPPEEDELDEEDEDAESEEEDADEESESEEEEEPEEEEESTEEDSEASDEDESEEAEAEGEEDAKISRDVARDRLEDKTKDELYSLAVEEDVDDRSDMNKDELVEALLDERDQVADE